MQRLLHAKDAGDAEMIVGGVPKVAENADLYRINAVGLVIILELFYYKHV